jgi:hypothetical protein
MNRLRISILASMLFVCFETIDRLFAGTPRRFNAHPSSTGSSTQPAGDGTHHTNATDSACSTHAADALPAADCANRSITTDSGASSSHARTSRADAHKSTPGPARATSASSARAEESHTIFAGTANASDSAHVACATNKSHTDIATAVLGATSAH